MTTLEKEARAFAAGCHADQARKYTGESYVEHPAAVAELVRSVPHDRDMLLAAWLHDVVEDCGITIREIESRFGIAAAALVEMVTDVSRPQDGNRAKRKALDRSHLAQASSAAKTVKLADLIDNTCSIVARDPKFAKVYLAEKALLLPFLREGNATLWQMAEIGIRQWTN